MPLQVMRAGYFRNTGAYGLPPQSKKHSREIGPEKTKVYTQFRDTHQLKAAANPTRLETIRSRLKQKWQATQVSKISYSSDNTDQFLSRISLEGSHVEIAPKPIETKEEKKAKEEAAILAREQELMAQDLVRFKNKVEWIQAKQPHILGPTIVKICRFIEKYRADNPVISVDEYIRESESGRNIQFNADGKVIIHFSRTDLGDQILCKNPFWKVPVYSMDYDTGKWFCSYSEICERKAAIAKCNFQRTRHLPYFNKMISSAEYFRKNEDKVITVTRFTLELAECGNLRTLVKNNVLTLGEKLNIACQIAEGLAALHGENLLHRDIKMENILVDDDGNATIGDLDTVCRFNSERRKSSLASYPYNSPEVAAAHLRDEDFTKDINTKFDMFSFGCMLHELFIGPLPWNHEYNANESHETTQVRILTEIGLKTKKLNSWFPEPKDNLLHYMIWRLLAHEPSERPSATDVKAILTQTRILQ